MSDESPILDPRAGPAILQDLVTRVPAYVPGWIPTEGGPGQAVLDVFGRDIETLAVRINQAPDKNKLAFLDQLGVTLLTAAAARAPVVFRALPNVGDGRVPARTRVGATVAGASGPVVFETEQDVALASAQLAEVVTLWPGRDAYADHSAALLAGEPFTLFDPLIPVPHEFYLAHDTYFALAGQAIVELSITLTTPSSAPLPLAWEYWESAGWRPFNPPIAVDTAGESFDATIGLTRSGTVRLVASCATAAKTTVAGIQSYWIRARTTAPMIRAPGVVRPSIEALLVRTVLEKDVWTVKTTALPPAASVDLSATLHDGSGAPLSADVGVYSAGNASFGFFNTVPDLGSVRTATDGSTPGAGTVPGVGPSFAIDVLVTGATSDVPAMVTAMTIDTVPVRLDYTLYPGAQPDAAFANESNLDLTKAGYPFGHQPQAGDTFYIACEEAFGKPGADVTLYANAPNTSPPGTFIPPVDFVFPTIAVEYWTGKRWQSLALTSQALTDFFELGVPLAFTIPRNLGVTTVNGTAGRWIRFRMVDAGFTGSQPYTFTAPDPSNPSKTITYTFSIVVPMPPVLSHYAFGYVYRSHRRPPTAAVAYNDFQWSDQSDALTTAGATIAPFADVADQTPALYLGFDKPLPPDLVSSYLGLVEQPGVADGPRIRWEYYTGSEWLRLSVQDETRGLVLPGMVAATWPGVDALPPVDVIQATGTTVQLADPRGAAGLAAGDQLYIVQGPNGELTTLATIDKDQLTVRMPLTGTYSRASIGLARLPRFGTPRTWIRARLQDDGPPPLSQVTGMYVNAAWAVQVQTYENEVLGRGNGQPGQVVFVRNTPVLPGEIIEVRELDGARAAVELPTLMRSLHALGVPDTDVRTVTDPKTGALSEVWVRWRERPNLFFSGPADRHYMIERSRGRVIVGDNVNGRMFDVGIDNIRSRLYRAGGGVIGNVRAGAITQLLSGVLAQSVRNPRDAEGGAEGESIHNVLVRGPLVVRHRRQATTGVDYEALAYEASPGVAVARALPTRHPSGRVEPGWVTVIIVPYGTDPEPLPSFELRREVQTFLAARVPASMAGQVAVIGPRYVPVGVQAGIVPADGADPGVVYGDVAARLDAFLHPVTGGPTGAGWAFGRSVYLSDVATALTTVDGIDHLDDFTLLLAGTPVGDVVDVPPTGVVAAGPLRLRLVAAER